MKYSCEELFPFNFILLKIQPYLVVINRRLNRVFIWEIYIDVINWSNISYLIWLKSEIFLWSIFENLGSSIENSKCCCFFDISVELFLSNMKHIAYLCVFNASSLRNKVLFYPEDLSYPKKLPWLKGLLSTQQAVG